MDTIKYDKLYLNTPVRPPIYGMDLEPDNETLALASSLLGGIVVGRFYAFDYNSAEDNPYDAVVSILIRHPMHQFEIENLLDQMGCGDSKSIFERLDKDSRIECLQTDHDKHYRGSVR